MLDRPRDEHLMHHQMILLLVCLKTNVMSEM